MKLGYCMDYFRDLFLLLVLLPLSSLTVVILCGLCHLLNIKYLTMHS